MHAVNYITFTLGYGSCRECRESSLFGKLYFLFSVHWISGPQRVQKNFFNWYRRRMVLIGHFFYFLLSYWRCWMFL